MEKIFPIFKIIQKNRDFFCLYFLLITITATLYNSEISESAKWVIIVFIVI